MTEAEKRMHRVCFTGHRPEKLARPDRAIKKDLEKELKEILPPFMVPNKTIQLEEMPLNKNGKIDRHALEAIYQKPSGK